MLALQVCDTVPSILLHLKVSQFISKVETDHGGHANYILCFPALGKVTDTLVSATPVPTALALRPWFLRSEPISSIHNRGY